jgi:hypothetical protein
VAVFVVSSIAQIAKVVLGSPDALPAVGGECAEAMKREFQSIEAARAAASLEPRGEAAKARYANERRSSSEKSPDVQRACSADPHGTEALVALAELDRASEESAFRAASELSPVRLSAQSFISGPRK